MSATIRSWHQASLDLARRVNRRARWAAILEPSALGLLVGALATLAVKAAGGDLRFASLLPLVGAALGFVLGALRAHGIRPAVAWEAAWALDRLAGAKERGLTAALVEGPVGAEAAWGSGRTDPPSVRLKPPAGLALAVGAALLAAVAVAAPSAAADAVAKDEGPDASTAAIGGSARKGDTADAPDERAALEARKAEEAENVRVALGLAKAASSDPAALAERLADPAARDAARRAADAGGELGNLLAGDPAAAARALSGALDKASADGEEAMRLRTEAAAARAREAVLPVPASRRLVVERYFSRLAEGGGR